MGEYATRKSDGVEVKIGTCESMYYLTLGDRNKVNYRFDYNHWWHWRLPNLPAYEQPGDGNYEDWKEYRGTIINEDRFWELVHRDFSQDEIDKNKGIMQLKGENGYLVNIACYHGDRLPQTDTDEVNVFWNGKAHHMRIAYVHTRGAIADVGICCRFCGRTVNLEELEYIMKNEYEYTEDSGKKFMREKWICGEDSERMFKAIKADIEDYLAKLPESVKAKCETAKE